MFRTILLSLALASLTWAECPDLESLDIKYNSDTFMCGYYWQEKGADNPIKACNAAGPCRPDSSRFSMKDGYDFTAVEGGAMPIGSLAVLPGCTFYEFDDFNYSGSAHSYYSGIIPNYKAHVGMADGNCPNAARSYKCRCTQKMISCQPDDEFVIILSCDNTAGSQPLSCQYSETQGTSYGQSATESISVSTSVSNEIRAGIAQSYDQFGISTTTGYDWSGTSQQTFDMSSTVTISADALPGELLRIEQAVGHCDDNDSFTNFFKASSRDAQGRIISTNYFTREADGSFRKVAAPGQ